MHIFTLHGFMWLLAWKYMTICNISSLRTAMFFLVKEIDLARGAYALTFTLVWVLIFFPIFTTLPPPDLMISNMAWGRCPFLLGASLKKCWVLFHQVSYIPSISTSLVIFILGIFVRRLLCRWMLAFPFTSHHNPHLTTGWCVTFVFLCNGWFVVSAKVFHMAGCAIDQHCLRTDHPINLSFVKSDAASAVWWFDPDRFPNLVYITSDFWRRWFGVYALHMLLILVYAICWHARRTSTIEQCDLAAILSIVQWHCSAMPLPSGT